MTEGTPARPQTGAARRASKAQHRARQLPPEVETGGVMSITSAAHYLDVSRWTLYRLIEDGEFPTLYVKTLRRVRRADLDAYIERQAQAS